MILSDNDILKELKQGSIVIDPFDPSSLGPCSIDLKLDSLFRIYKPGSDVDIQDRKLVDRDTELIDTGEKPFKILPGQFVLGQTREKIAISVNLAGILEGRSSIARLGIVVHAAGLVNPGTGIREPGKLTLEVFCMNRSPVLLYPGTGIVQIMFAPLSSTARTGYDERASSQYVGQVRPEI